MEEVLLFQLPVRVAARELEGVTAEVDFRLAARAGAEGLEGFVAHCCAWGWSEGYLGFLGGEFERVVPVGLYWIGLVLVVLNG